VGRNPEDGLRRIRHFCIGKRLRRSHAAAAVCLLAAVFVVFHQMVARNDFCLVSLLFQELLCFQRRHAA